jgi:DNA-binding protein HU-beta
MDEIEDDKPAEANEKMAKRGQVVAAVVEKTGLPRAKAMAAVDAVFESVTAFLQTGKEVRLAGFGTFAVSSRKAGKGRDPRTGAEIDIAAGKSVRFRAGKGLREAVGGAAVEATSE